VSLFRCCSGQVEYEYLEFFCGRANLTFAMRQKRKMACKFDVNLSERKPDRRTNFMDLLGASGFA
jgi:hypothetical protein